MNQQAINQTILSFLQPLCWHLIELVEVTPVPLNEDVRDPSCKQAPVTNEPLPATMLPALEASLRHADENDEEGVQTAVFAANAAAIPASSKSTPTKSSHTHTQRHFLSPFFFSKRDLPTTKGAPNTFEKNGRVKKSRQPKKNRSRRTATTVVAKPRKKK
jgi:hypothetical protein